MSIVAETGENVNPAKLAFVNYATIKPMDISLVFSLATTVVAIGVLYVLSWVASMWQRRAIWSEASAGLLVAGLPFVFATHFSFLVQLLLLMVQLWLLLLVARLAFGRLNAEFLMTSTRLNSSVALLVLAFVLLYGVIGERFSFVLALLAASIIVGVAFLYQVMWTLKHYRLRKLNQQLSLHDLPTVTLAIPARNETHALAECLRAAVVSDYPKLEILVADDCSQDKTSEIIRSFAHDGVRFVQGNVPSEGWLGKNEACQTLADEADGGYIIFAGVDTHLSPQSITKLVTYALSHRVSMVSVLPTRRDGLHGATIFSQLRYYWQVVLPITKRRVPVASPCWLIKADALHQLGGFAAARQKIVPEGSFARRLFGVNLYRFVISNDELGITTAKKWSSQNESALRLLYPTFKRQPFFTLIGALLLIGLQLAPLILLLVASFDLQLGWVFWLSLLATALLFAGYGLVVMRTHPRTWPVTLLCFPLSLVQELVLLAASMVLYEFGTVNWKGRNVCYPVIRPLR